LKTSERSVLLPQTIKNSLYVKLNVCNLSYYYHQPAVIKWLSDKKKHNEVHPHALQQQWYEGVYQKASRLAKTSLTA